MKIEQGHAIAGSKEPAFFLSTKKTDLKIRAVLLRQNKGNGSREPGKYKGENDMSRSRCNENCGMHIIHYHQKSNSTFFDQEEYRVPVEMLTPKQAAGIRAERVRMLCLYAGYSKTQARKAVM